MTQPLERIFLGSTPAPQRRFVTGALAHLRARGYKQVVIPCVGQFTLARCALAAGYPAKTIRTSEISLFSSVLGHLFSGRPLAELEFEVGEDWCADYRRRRTEPTRAAFLLWLMKVAQLRRDLVYQRELWLEYVERREHYLRQLHAQLEEMLKTYAGLRYEIADLRDVLAAARPASSVVLVNPPGYTKGYAKMFDFGDQLRFNAGAAEFDLEEEGPALYEASAEKPELVLWHRSLRDGVRIGPDVVFASQAAGDRLVCWQTPRPQELAGCPALNEVQPRARAEPHAYGPVVGANDEFGMDSTIRFVHVDEGAALYYRDLWAHKLGSTEARIYLLMLVDDKVYATVGLTADKLTRHISTRVFENFGFTARPHAYRRPTRLLMMCLTSREFGDFVPQVISRANRLWDLRGIRTVCLSKYRKVKHNTDLFRLESREKLPDGSYHLVYDTDFRDEDFAGCLRRFLEEEAAARAD